METHVEVIIISGRSGSGKTSTAFEVCEQLCQRNIAHANLEADYLDDIWPEEQGSELLHMNLFSLWSNLYHRRGCRRLILSGTAVVIETEAVRQTLERVSVSDPVTGNSVGEDSSRVRIHPIILTAADSTAKDRLSRREIGTALDRHVESSNKWGSKFSVFPGWAMRVSTDERSVYEVAMDILRRASWVE